MAVKTANFDKGVDGATITTGDAGDADVWDGITGTFKYAKEPSIQGLSAKIDGGLPEGLQALQWNFNPGTTHYGRAYLFPLNTVGGGRYVNPQEAFIASRGSISVNTGSGNVFNLNDRVGTTQAVTTLGIKANEWTRIEWKFIQSDTVGQIELKMFAGRNCHGVTPDDVATSAANLDLGVPIDVFQFGNMDDNSVVTFWESIVAGAAAYPGPAITLPLGVNPDYSQFPKPLLRR